MARILKRRPNCEHIRLVAMKTRAGTLWGLPSLPYPIHLVSLGSRLWSRSKSKISLIELSFGRFVTVFCRHTKKAGFSRRYSQSRLRRVGPELAVYMTVVGESQQSQCQRCPSVFCVRFFVRFAHFNLSSIDLLFCCLSPEFMLSLHCYRCFQSS
jgi:hypothetical protein